MAVFRVNPCYITLVKLLKYNEPGRRLESFVVAVWYIQLCYNVTCFLRVLKEKIFFCVEDMFAIISIYYCWKIIALDCFYVAFFCSYWCRLHFWQYLACLWLRVSLFLQDFSEPAVCCTFKREKSSIYIGVGAKSTDSTNWSNHSFCTANIVSGIFSDLTSYLIFSLFLFKTTYAALLTFLWILLFRGTQLVCHLKTLNSSFGYKPWNNKLSCEMVSLMHCLTTTTDGITI